MSPRSRQGSTVSQGSRFPEHLLVVQRGVNGTVAGGGGQGLGGSTGSGQHPAGTGRPSATQSDFSVASRSRTTSPVLSTQQGAGTASRRIILPA